MLFVPWVYGNLEDRRVPSSDVVKQARQEETALVKPLLASDRGSRGVYGSQVGRALKRLPSSIYWAGLSAWGIRVFPGSQDQYHRALDAIYRRRDRQAKRRVDSEPAPAGTLTWHRRLPRIPAGYPRKLSFRLEEHEAVFLRECIVEHQRPSLLAHMALNCEPADCAFPWEHPDRASFTRAHKTLLDHARRFSLAIKGANLIYSLQLAELAGRDDWTAQHRASLKSWSRECRASDLSRWRMEDFWPEVVDRGHRVTLLTRYFVEEWVERIARGPAGLADDAGARKMVRERERRLKTQRSRFDNRRALEDWGGESGGGRLDFRWSTARGFLQELHEGIRGR